MTLDCEAYAQRIFGRVRDDFPLIATTITYAPHPFVAIMMVFERQPRLNFKVTATLQSGDELGLSVGEAFWCEWFPAGDEHVRNKFEQALRGILSGEMRVIEYRRSNRIVKAHLQEPEGGDWKRVATWSSVHFPSFFSKRRTVLQNSRA